MSYHITLYYINTNYTYIEYKPHEVYREEPSSKNVKSKSEFLQAPNTAKGSVRIKNNLFKGLCTIFRDPAKIKGFRF